MITLPATLSPNDTCAIMVCYQTDESVLDHIGAIAPQVRHLIVIDNGTDKATSHLTKAAKTYKNVSLQTHPENNLAAAQNVGISYAKDNKYAAILLLDDDSQPSESLAEALCQHYNSYHNTANPLGIVAPRLRLSHQKETQYLTSRNKWHASRQACPEGVHIEHGLTVIASGSLIPLALFDKIDAMDESFSIDYIDQDFCLRTRLAGFSIHVCGNATLTHHIGNSEENAASHALASPTHHSAERRHTIYRNRMICWRRYFTRWPAYVAYDMSAALVDLYRITVQEQQRRGKLCMAFRGLRDGLFIRRTS